MSAESSLKNSDAELPTLAEYLFGTSLYRELAISSAEQAMKLFDGGDRIRGYCVQCKDMSVFFAHSGAAGIGQHTGIYTQVFKCAIDLRHHITTISRVTDLTIMKVGQYPSLADIAGARVRQLTKVLSMDDARELQKAIGLHAHDVGAGSLIYLRRIFERLIDKAGDRKANEDINWNRTGWDKKKMVDRIVEVKELLPSLIVEQKDIYGKLSEGVHDMPEHECLKLFEVMLKGIELILEQEWTAKKVKERETAFKKELHSL